MHDTFDSARLFALALATSLLGGTALAAEPAVEGYADFRAFQSQVREVAKSPLAEVRTLVKTAGGREVFLLTVGSGPRDQKPAVLVVGGVDGSHLVGSELALRVARRLVEAAREDKGVRQILDRATFYFIPRPSPDASEAFFRRPWAEPLGNGRSTDDDGDGRMDEDGPDDLDGDGWITSIRVRDATGPYRLDPKDDRVLVKTDPKKHERSGWSVYSEGRDNDEDERLGEDPPGGVSFNRNFPFQYPFFERGAGPFQVSEPETRAVADFLVTHPNVAAVLVFTPEDNLLHPWEAETGASGDKSGEKNEGEQHDKPEKRIQTKVAADDAPTFRQVAKLYEETIGRTDAPKPPEGKGSFSEWVYFHEGRWSFACRGWWFPKVEPEEPEEKNEDGADEGDGDADDGGRGEEDRNALAWFEREGIDAFVPWHEIDHPDFPGRRVEVGGFKPFLRLNPPADELEPLAEAHGRFLRELAGLLPRIAIDRVETEPLGAGVWRVTASVVNEGALSTMPAMGETVGVGQPLQAELLLPKGAALVTGYPRVRLPRLAGEGGRAETSWLVRVKKGCGTSVRLRVWSPAVGEVAKRVTLTLDENKP